VLVSQQVAPIKRYVPFYKLRKRCTADHRQVKKYLFFQRFFVVGDTGLEPVDLTSLPRNDLRESQFQRGAKSDAFYDAAEFAEHLDPALGAVVDAWPMLPPSSRMAIESIVQAALVTS